MKHAFEVGLIPLGDLYGDHNERWVTWKQDVQTKIDETLGELRTDTVEKDIAVKLRNTIKVLEKLEETFDEIANQQSYKPDVD
jgi:hypothetical protein